MRNGPPIPRQRFYRIVTAMDPPRDDFASYGELGVKPKRPLSPREEDRWWGLSVFSTEEAATQRSDDSPWLGRHIATIEIPLNAQVRIQQTGRNPYHFTIWAPAEHLLRWIIFIRPLDDVQ
jgi:hypothetical protein